MHPVFAVSALMLPTLAAAVLYAREPSLTLSTGVPYALAPLMWLHVTLFPYAARRTRDQALVNPQDIAVRIVRCG